MKNISIYMILLMVCFNLSARDIEDLYFGEDFTLEIMTEYTMVSKKRGNDSRICDSNY